MLRLVFGFDPGNSSGAVVCLRATGDTVTHSTSLPYPVIKSKKSTGRTFTEINIEELYDFCVNNIADFLREAAGKPHRICFVCEKVNAMPKQGSVSTFSFGDGFGQIKSLCRILKRTSNGTFFLIRPQEWKQLLLKGTTRDKGAGEQFLRDRYHMIDLHCNKNGKPHSGIVDAACIALYAVNLNNT